ncbi:MAG: UvrD-helicase domain-containing protein [Bacillota bacterium]
MINSPSINKAELAATEALHKIYTCISLKKNFVLEAGAGAGKTYSLIQALRHIIKTQGQELLRRGQKVACITYTNVAKKEIESRTDSHPIIFSATIHSFCWSLIKGFQPRIRKSLPNIDKWAERLLEVENINTHIIRYDTGIPKITNNEIMLGHQDVLTLTTLLMEDIKFRKLLSSKYPIIFIDEYQDTDNNIVDSLKSHFLDDETSPLFGFFGDHWQKIYGTGCGKINHESIENIGKRANFRSSRLIVETLNRMRPELTQEPSSLNPGSVIVYHTNSWEKERRLESHWKGDLPQEDAHHMLSKTRFELTNNGWDFSPDKTKILMLTHNILAHEQGYMHLAAIFNNNDRYIKKEDDYISFFANVLEPVCNAYELRNYGKMFSILEGRMPLIRSHKDKLELASNMNTLINLRKTGTVGNIIEHLRKTKYPSLPANLYKIEDKIDLLCKSTDIDDSEKKMKEFNQKLKSVSYQEVISLCDFIENQTPFATKHGVKGAEFENVLVVIGRGWNMYNFAQMLEYSTLGVPSSKLNTYERNRNLFYVACSRPKNNLALLFTQELSEHAVEALSNWFGSDSIKSII